MVRRVMKRWSKRLACSPSPRVEAPRAYLFRTAGKQCFRTTRLVAGMPFRRLDVPSVFLSGSVTAFHQEQVTMMIFCPPGCRPFTLRGKLWFGIQPPDRVAVDHEQMRDLRASLLEADQRDVLAPKAQLPATNWFKSTKLLRDVESRRGAGFFEEVIDPSEIACLEIKRLPYADEPNHLVAIIG